MYCDGNHLEKSQSDGWLRPVRRRFLREGGRERVFDLAIVGAFAVSGQAGYHDPVAAGGDDTGERQRRALPVARHTDTVVRLVAWLPPKLRATYLVGASEDQQRFWIEVFAKMARRRQASLAVTS
jgi:hypothetical protein